MSPKKALPAIALGVLLVLAGCSGFVGQELGDQREAELVERLENRIEDISTIEATVSFEGTYGEQSMSSATELKANFDTGEYWTETLEPTERAGDVTVYNGSAMAFYDESENTYRVHDATFSVGGESNLSESLDRVVERTDIVYNGTERIGDRETAKFTLVPTNGTGAYDSVTLWADTDRMIPVQIRMESSPDAATTMTLSDVDLNAEFPEGTFEFDPPADATREESSQMVVESETYESYDELTAAVDLDVPPADLGDGFRFQSARTVTTNGSSGAVDSATLTYADGDTDVSVSVTSVPEGASFEYSDAESVTIDGHAGQYRTVAGTGNVMWICDGTQYLVYGDAEKSTLLSVADSVGC